jgi:pimeloyl-ACP methyl ester carboxylesterase
MLHVLFSRPDEIPAEVAVSVVWGNRDVLLPAEKQRRVAAPAHAKWIVLDDCAHVPMWDQPTRTVSIIDQTVQRSLTA